MRIAITDDAESFVLVGHWRWEAWHQKLSDPKTYSYFGTSSLSCTVNDLNALVIHDAANGELEFVDDTAKAYFEKELALGLALNETAKKHAAWELNKTVPDGTLCENEDLPLADYQRVACHLSRSVPGFAYFMEQGTGKTPPVVVRICTDAQELKEDRMYRVIVVCPKNVRLNWKNEIERFASCPGKVVVLRDGPVKRIRALAQAMSRENDEKFTVVIVSYGLLVQSWDTVLKYIPFDLAVCDETHNFKAPKAGRTEAVLALRDNATKRMALTGTPVVNSALDLYTQLEFLEKGLSGFKSFNAFKNKFGVYAKSHDGTRDVLQGVQNLPVIKERLAQVSFRVTKDQVLKDLPEKQYDIVEVEMGTKQAEDYAQLSTQLALEIEEMLDKAEESKRSLIMNNALVKMMKLAQITSGFLYLSAERGPDGEVIHEKDIYFYRDNPKLDALEEEIRQMGPNDKWIIWSCWRPDMQMIAARFSKMGLNFVEFHGGTKDLDREESVRRYNYDPSCKLFLGNPEAGSAGLNLLGYDYDGSPPQLLTNTTRMIHYANSYKPVQRWQSDDRGHRRGTRCPVRISDLVVPNTIDEDIRVRVLNKKKSALDVQDLREILKKVRERAEA